ncbi:MAG: acyl carrier protein, partial [Ktedonobacteraceae bacterium]
LNWHQTTTFFSSPVVNGRWKQLQTQEQAPSETAVAQSGDFLAVLHAAKPEEREPLIFTALQKLLQQVLGVALSSIDQQHSLKELGLDSLMAMELRNTLKQQMDVDIPIMQLLRLQSIADLTACINQHQQEKLHGEPLVARGILATSVQKTSLLLNT